MVAERDRGRNKFHDCRGMFAINHVQPEAEGYLLTRSVLHGVALVRDGVNSSRKIVHSVYPMRYFRFMRALTQVGVQPLPSRRRTGPSALVVRHGTRVPRGWTTTPRLCQRSGRRAIAGGCDRQRKPSQGRPGSRHLGRPLRNPARYDYVGEWVIVKLRWRLAVDTLEKGVLTTLEDGCRDVTVILPMASESRMWSHHLILYSSGTGHP